MRIIAAVLFLLVTVILSVVSILFALIDPSGRLYLWLAKAWSRIFLFLFRTKVSVSGASNIKKGNHYVFCSNHSSYADIPVLSVAVPQYIRLILRNTLTRIPIWGWALVASPMIIIDRSNAVKARKTLTRAVEIIKGGASVLLFPEGTRTRDGNLQSFKRGAFHLAYESEVEVIPVAIKGTFELMPRTENLPKTGKHVSVRIGEPLKIDTNITGDREREMDLMRRTEESIRRLLG
jgi:1-acyl-sn-glycerol-3-phosphate acyltransferase